MPDKYPEYSEHVNELSADNSLKLDGLIDRLTAYRLGVWELMREFYWELGEPFPPILAQ